MIIEYSIRYDMILINFNKLKYYNFINIKWRHVGLQYFISLKALIEYRSQYYAHVTKDNV